VEGLVEGREQNCNEQDIATADLGNRQANTKAHFAPKEKSSECLAVGDQ
jgi:hypothetical protein